MMIGAATTTSNAELAEPADEYLFKKAFCELCGFRVDRRPS